MVSLGYEHGHGGFTVLGKHGKRAEQVGAEATQEAVQFHRSAATVDSHLADQLLLYMALAAGRSELHTTEVTEHLRTNAAVAGQISTAEVDLDETGRLVLVGAGLGRGRCA